MEIHLLIWGHRVLSRWISFLLVLCLFVLFYLMEKGKISSSSKIGASEEFLHLHTGKDASRLT